MRATLDAGKHGQVGVEWSSFRFPPIEGLSGSPCIRRRADQCNLQRLPFPVCSGPCASSPRAQQYIWGDRWGAAPGATTVHSLTVREAAAHMAIFSAPEANLTTLDCRQ